MSVLLEALKKAAAEKKRAMEGTVDTKMVHSDSHKVSDKMTAPPLKLSTEKVGSVASIVESSKSAVEEELDVATPLSFTLSDMSAPEFNQDELDQANTEPSLSVESSALVSDNIDHVSEESDPLLNEVQLNTADSFVDENELNQDISQVTSSILNDSERASSPDLESNTLFETDKDSFEWSMNALPGYATALVDDSTPIEKNSILLTGALTSEPKIERKNSSSWLLVLIVVLIFIGISVYGLNYYQSKSEQLENSMRKYKLDKIQSALPKKPLPVAVAVDRSLQNANQSSQKLDFTPDVTVKDAIHASSVSNTTTSNLVVLPVAQKELNTSVVKGSKKSVVKPKNTPSSIKKRTASPIKQPVLVKFDQTKIPLSEAYSAYERGHLELSQQKFNEVLTLDPKNIMAMIGLGGIAASAGHYYIAMDHYQQALNIEPNSLSVYEAIANLSTNIELNSDWYGSLKNMATIYPNSAPLQFALGNLYASNNDWLAAQEYYFNAYALDMNNPDFTANLAISLDRLGKYPLAGQYYTQTLALAGATQVSFNVSDIKNRLISIRQFMDQEK
ncbi:tetratricopeptide repeat protein [Thiomicrorhabdus arctica]|uniref:tetratricopeptide repeat protein n=1 Tax=Thiomicrorhabdus arctica TaxID=131540 RepID=UPI00037D3DC2|nr:tetratricopeptide repeat protein [Thiomicrorhabdus arctica]